METTCRECLAFEPERGSLTVGRCALSGRFRDIDTPRDCHFRDPAHEPMFTTEIKTSRRVAAEGSHHGKA